MYVCICLLLDIHVKQPIPFDHLVVMRPYFKQNEVRTSCSRSFWRSCLFSHPPSTGYNKNTTCGYVILCSWVFGGSYYIKFICKNALHILSVSDGQLSIRPHYTGIVHAVSSIKRREGFKGLYRGVAVNVLVSGATWGSYFFL